jgi:hypothetical protein
MLPKHLFPERENGRTIGWRSAKFVSATGVSLSALCFSCTVVLICGAAPLELIAQAPPTRYQQQQRALCEANVVNPPLAAAAALPPAPAEAPAPKTPDNIQDGTRAALACEWIDPSGVENVLRALGFLTGSLPAPDPDLRALRELQNGDHYPLDEGLYVTAMGDLDVNGPRVQGLPNFLDMLAKANTLKKKKPDDEDGLFVSTKAIIEGIFKSGRGKLALVRINASFGRKDNYVALYQLLEAGWQKHDAGDLEKLRAAFEMNTELLAKQVAAKITAAKE